MEVSLAFALLNEAVIKPTAQGIIDDFKKGLEEDFETIYKPKGLNACKAFVDNKNIITRSPKSPDFVATSYAKCSI
ncbi:MAG: hypothetical protein IM568_12355 [Flavobacterium sp.]|nr:hypothetical protein [Flavobacterium sp.]